MFTRVSCNRCTPWPGEHLILLFFEAHAAFAWHCISSLDVHGLDGHDTLSRWFSEESEIRRWLTLRTEAVCSHFHSHFTQDSSHSPSHPYTPPTCVSLTVVLHGDCTTCCKLATRLKCMVWVGSGQFDTDKFLGRVRDKEKVTLGDAMRCAVSFPRACAVCWCRASQCLHLAGLRDCACTIGVRECITSDKLDRHINISAMYHSLCGTLVDEPLHDMHRDNNSSNNSSNNRQHQTTTQQLTTIRPCVAFSASRWPARQWLTRPILTSC
jgi:hypothetical protein